MNKSDETPKNKYQAEEKKSNVVIKNDAKQLDLIFCVNYPDCKRTCIKEKADFCDGCIFSDGYCFLWEQMN